MEQWQQKDRICFFGDSITANGMFIQRILDYYLDQRHIGLEVYNMGVPGDNATNALKRLHLVLNRKPSRVVIMFGMNDINRDLYFPSITPRVDERVVSMRRAAIDQCVESQLTMMKIFQKHKIKVTVCTPTLFDELSDCDAENGVGLAYALAEIGQRLCTSAADLGAEVVDFSTLFFRQQKHQVFSGHSLIGQDRIHPAGEGHEVMAQIFLSQQGFDIAVEQDFDTLTALAKRELSGLRKKRKELEDQIVILNLIEWSFYYANKDHKPFLEFLKENENRADLHGDFVTGCIKTYLAERNHKGDYEKELIRITKEIMEQAAC